MEHERFSHYELNYSPTRNSKSIKRKFKKIQDLICFAIGRKIGSYKINRVSKYLCSYVVSSDVQIDIQKQLNQCVDFVQEIAVQIENKGNKHF